MSASEFDKATTEFIEWLRNDGVEISPKVKIQDLRSQNQGRGLVATEDIEEEETLFTLPESTILSIKNNTLLSQKPHLRESLEALSSWESLIIILLYEVYALPDSKWKHYFEVLPIRDSENYKSDQLMFWSEEELAHLKPSLIVDRIGRESAEEMYNKLFPGVVVEKLGINELNEVTLEQYHSVASLIMSYSFDVFDVSKDPENEQNGADASESDDEDDEDDDDRELIKAMVPLADTLNADTKLHNASLTPSGSELRMVAIKNIKKGDQIYNTYSDHPNSEILRRYGYVESDGSKYDFGEVPLHIIENHFTEKMGIKSDSFDRIITVLKKIADEGEAEDYQNIVLDSYDCFKDYEVIIELTFIIQVLSLLSSINQKYFLHQMNEHELYSTVFLVYKKCYKLIESGKLTNSFIPNYREILESRMQEYPLDVINSTSGETDSGRSVMCKIVLRSEYTSLKNCLEVEKVFNNEFGKFKFIAEEKATEDIIKKRFSDTDGSSKKKSKKH
ncbi:Piso0_005574 [Millerozyma farinosa CBS 7064]|uniref:Ribosomal lysine N-methyltransferase 4 n=1 Tax=Pichia sorbitophila (strain ATCC MYA-4447 / BCRC 22081 / CBS 7064 / NBRC 10061 / NRRL Y-12695) TaxID=559304 RepID=G8XZD0_PICSO|nr:Piso0_005574 [Millerozyma farinosa CBS 7064]